MPADKRVLFATLLWRNDRSAFAIYHPILTEKKEEIWLGPMTKAHTPTEMSKGQSDNTNNATKKFDYTAVADRHRTVGVTTVTQLVWLTWFTGPTFPLPATAV